MCCNTGANCRIPSGPIYLWPKLSCVSVYENEKGIIVFDKNGIGNVKLLCCVAMQ